MPGPVFLEEHEAQKIHNVTLGVLEKTGIFLDHDEAESLFLEGGARKDEFGRILIPPSLVEEAIDRSLSKIQMYDREGNRSMLLRNGRTFFGPGSDALYNVDKETGEIRRSVLSDVRDNVRIADALAGFSFVMSMALPDDVPVETLYATIFAETVANTTKPLIATATSLEDVERTHRIASIVAGGEEALRRKPFYLAYLEPISPLRFDRSGVERLLYCAQHEIPIVFAAGANCGGGAPVTPEGGVVQGGAESLAGLVLALLKNENARFVYGANTSAMDMTTSIVSYGAPEWFRTVAMYADVGRHYDLPTWGTAGCSDSFHIDAQAALEAYEGILMALQCGTTLAHDVGYLAHGALYDARMLVLADEMIRRARYLLKPADLSEEALATVAIDEASRNKELASAHSSAAETFWDLVWFVPTYIGKRGTLHARSEKELVDLLTDRMKEVLNAHEPALLPAGVADDVDRYLGSL